MINENSRGRLRRLYRTADELAEMERSLDALEARADEVERRLDRFGRYVLAFERDGFEFLMEPRLFWGPPRTLVRRGRRTLEVWLDPDDIHVLLNRGFSDLEERRALHLVRNHVDELRDLWFGFRNDWKRDRLERLPWVAPHS